MLKMTLNNLQLFAHKRWRFYIKTDVIHKRNVLESKVADGQTVTGGSILYRQRGTTHLPRCKRWTWWDDTLFVKVEGVVRFERKGRDKKTSSVYPLLNKKVQ